MKVELKFAIAGFNEPVEAARARHGDSVAEKADLSVDCRTQKV